MPPQIDLLRQTLESVQALRADLSRWLDQSRLLDGPYRNQGGEDEANYSLTWFSHYLITNDDAILDRFRSLLADLAGWVASDCEHGYEPEAEAHHGTEPFLLFLPRYLGVAPDDEIARELLEDAAHHIGNWEPSIPPWYDWERDVFRGYSIGSRVVDDSEHNRIELCEHLRFVHIALAAYRVSGESRYLDWALRYGRKRAERLIASGDPVPLAWTHDGDEIQWRDVERYPKSGGMLALNHKLPDDPLAGIENHLASGAVMAYGDLFEASGDSVFRDAARRIVAPLIDQLTDPFSDPSAAAVSHYRDVFGDTSFDDEALRVFESAPPTNDMPWVLMEPEQPILRTPGPGKRKDMLYWGELADDGSARPLREPSTAASSLAYQISGDVAHAHRALSGAARKFSMARRILRGGREHADMGGAICSVAAGHGRNWGTGAVTGCYGPLLLGCRDAFGAVQPLVTVRDADGTQRLPDDVLSLVRPTVGDAAGDLLLYNSGSDSVSLSWQIAGQDTQTETLQPGAVHQRPLGT